MKLYFTDQLYIDSNEIIEEFVHASGPGGQNVNKVSTAVKLKFNINNSVNLSPEIKERLIKLAGKKVSQEGILTIDARRFRSQKKNREDARTRLLLLLKKAAKRPRIRRKTQTPHKAKEKRLKIKRKRSEIKNLRKKPSHNNDE